ncbi:MAG: hypothetical protein ABI434_24240, partial [Burkholderiaceae bacterium]
MFHLPRFRPPFSSSVMRAVAIAGAVMLSSGTPLTALAQNTLVVAAPQTPTGFDGDTPKVATR